MAGFVLLAVACVLLLPFGAIAQKTKAKPHNSHKTLNTDLPKSEIKAKTVDEITEFVIVDFRQGAIVNVIEPDEDVAGLKEELEEKFPGNTVFKSSHPKVCVVGVDGSANAKSIISGTNPKTSKKVSRADLDKALAKINVKLVTKEK